MLHLSESIISKLGASICLKIYLCRKAISRQTERSKGQIQQRRGQRQRNFFPFLDLLSHFFFQLYFSSDEEYFLPDPNPICIYKKPHPLSILLWFKMVFLQCKNLINTAWWIWTGNGKHTNRYFISGSQSSENWYHWKGLFICHWVYLCLPSHSTGVKQNTIMLCLPHKGLQLQNLSLS